MEKSVKYQGYKIQSAPHHPTEGEPWRLRIFISLDDHRVARAREFSTDGMYATEQETDIHGIAFGQRLIDGKVEGRSVMDMKMANRRAAPRLHVQFSTTFSGSTNLDGTGLILDLSTGGCRIESQVTVEPGISVELRIHVPDLEWPLLIEAASVQWVRDQIFGLAFVRITDTEHQRLGQVIRDLERGLDGGHGDTGDRHTA